MTTQELRHRVNVTFEGYGHYKVTIKYRGKEYHCTSTNTIAVDRMRDDHNDSESCYPTPRQAMQALYDECKNKNNLY